MSRLLPFLWLCLAIGCGRGTNDSLRQAGRTIAGELAPYIAQVKQTGPVVIILPDDRLMGGMLGEEIAEGLAALASDKKWQIEQVRMHVSESVERDGEPMRRDEFVKLLKDRADAGLIISTMGAPSMTEQQVQQLGKSPPVFVITEFHLRHVESLPAALFKYVAVLRSGRTGQATATNALSLEERFDVLRKP